MIHAYRKPFSDTFVLEVEGREDANTLKLALNQFVTNPLALDLVHHLTRFLDGDEMPPPTEEDGGPFHSYDAVGEWGVYDSRNMDRRIGFFRKESVAREAAATLNALVEVDHKV